MVTNEPLDWNDFYIRFGRSVFFAQVLERNLALILCFHEARKRGVLKRPSPSEIDALIDEADGNTIGELLNKLSEFQCFDPTGERLFRDANENRRTLVRHFDFAHHDKFENLSGVGPACAEVDRLAAPIFEAMYLSKSLAEGEINRMDRENKSRRA